MQAVCNVYDAVTGIWCPYLGVGLRESRVHGNTGPSDNDAQWNEN
jgi:hypothetical protein